MNKGQTLQGSTFEIPINFSQQARHMQCIIQHSNTSVNPFSDRRAFKAYVREWFKSLNEYHASIAPTADQLINGTQPVYDVPPFTPKELAVLRSLDSANG